MTLFETTNKRNILSALWVVVMLNMLKADVLSLYIPGTVDNVIKIAGDTPVAYLMLSGSIIMEISILMIVLSQVLTHSINRWSNIIISLMTIMFVIGGGSTHPHYIFIATVEVVCLLLVAYVSWKWPPQQP